MPTHYNYWTCNICDKHYSSEKNALLCEERKTYLPRGGYPAGFIWKVPSDGVFGDYEVDHWVVTDKVKEPKGRWEHPHYKRQGCYTSGNKYDEEHIEHFSFNEPLDYLNACDIDHESFKKCVDYARLNGWDVSYWDGEKIVVLGN